MVKFCNMVSTDSNTICRKLCYFKLHGLCLCQFSCPPHTASL